MLSFESVEEVCESKSITLVVHPAIRRAVKGYEESFYIGLRCFLKGESDGDLLPASARWRLCPAYVLAAPVIRRAPDPES